MKNFTTRALNVKFPKEDAHHALQFPIYESVAFEFDSSEQIAANFRGEYPAHVYSRTSNPTVEYFERKMKTLTGAHQVLAVSSGMAAISASLLALTRSGDNIVASNHLFGHSYALLNQTLPDYGITTTFADLSNLDEVEKAIRPNTRVIFFETVTNPQLEIIDFEAISNLAHKHQIVVVCDSTVTPPIAFNASRWGIDVEVMSTTKFISGGATSVGGVILDHGTFDWNIVQTVKPYAEKFGKDGFIARLRKNIYRNTGTPMTAHAAYFQILGLDILELRYSKCVSNCLELGNYMENNPKINSVHYPALDSSPYRIHAQKYFNSMPGGVMTFDLDSQEKCYAFMNQLEIIRRATNLNDNKTLIIHPYSTIYTEFSEQTRTEMGIRSTTMRLSVGIEGAQDLIDDIERALANL